MLSRRLLGLLPALCWSWVSLCALQSDLTAQEIPSPGGKRIVRENRQPTAGGKSLAILIGVQNYSSLPKLNYCQNDVRLLEKTLVQSCNFDKVIVLTDDAKDANLQPTLGNLLTQLRIWLRVANSGEYGRILLYFSGHGFRDAESRLYFAPPDCDRQNLELSGLPQSYVRQQLDGCVNVPVKLLILDCCHAGEGRGGGVGESGAGLAGVFRSAKGLLTMASCLDDQVSLEWDAKKQGLFTYWLCQGLNGGVNAEVDRDRDALIDSSELYRYVFNHVQETAAEMAREQTVVLRPSEDWRGVAVLARVERGTKPGPRPGDLLTNSLGMKLAYVPAGEFSMGSPPDEAERGDDEAPHRVRITRGFYIGLYEVTQSEYQRVMRDNPSLFSASAAGTDPGRFPVEQVRWTDAVRFCEVLSSVADEKGAGRKYRLPTEAQWEYACRAGTTTPFHFGAACNGEKANCDGTFPYGGAPYGEYLERPTTVGSYPPNRFGLYDMHGNVWEWCQDGYRQDYQSLDADDPLSSDGSERVLRGGGWYNRPSHCRSARRNASGPATRERFNGFRVVCEPP